MMFDDEHMSKTTTMAGPVIERRWNSMMCVGWLARADPRGARREAAMVYIPANGQMRVSVLRRPDDGSVRKPRPGAGFRAGVCTGCAQAGTRERNGPKSGR